MTIQQKYTSNEVGCQAGLENNEIRIIGEFQFTLSLEPQASENK